MPSAVWPLFRSFMSTLVPEPATSAVTRDTSVLIAARCLSAIFAHAPDTSEADESVASVRLATPRIRSATAKTAVRRFVIFH